MDLYPRPGCIVVCPLRSGRKRRRCRKQARDSHLSGIAERAREEPVLLFRLRPDDRLDPSFGKRGRVVGRPRDKNLSAFLALGMTRQRNGRIVVVGANELGDPEGTVFYRFTVLRYLANGRVDRGFGSGGVAAVEPSSGGVAATALVVPDGRVVVGGGL